MVCIRQFPKTIQRAVAALTACLFLPALAGAEQDWVTTSNEHARIVLESIARFSPESAASMGLDGLDEKIMDLGPKLYERNLADSEQLLAELERRLAGAKHRLVRQDLEILVKAVRDSMTSAKLQHEHMLPYYNLNQQLFGSVRALIDPQVDRSRYPAAVVRIRRYAGLEDGYTPITEQARARMQERFDAGLEGPYRGQVEQDLQRAGTFIDGMRELLDDADLQDWQEPYETLAAQLSDYNDWLRAEILPRSREDFRLPPVIYANALQNWGVDASPEELIQLGTQGYMDIRNEMDALAPQVAQQHGYTATDYHSVIRQLKKDGPIDGDKLVDEYRNVLHRIEDIIRREHLITVPEREAGIRIGTAAETAAQPAAHVDLPRLLGNTGEYPTFVIPLITRREDGTWPVTDDSYQAGTWTLTAHEARPGHEMQFSSMLETGVSTARVIFAFNSANVEGWGLYAEAIMKPYLPLDAQLVSLQYRLLRAARMFLDPMLNLGLISPADAKRLLTEDVGVEGGWAQNEIERYTYRIPGQATAYYYGYTRLQSLRTRAEVALRDRFDQQAFHDFILAQGLLPPDILREAVMQDFVPSYQQ